MSRKGSAMPVPRPQPPTPADRSSETHRSSENNLTRRALLWSATASAAGAAHAPRSCRAAAHPANGVADTAVAGVDLHWLAGVPATTTGAAFGVPWPRGQVAAGTPFAVRDGDGRDVPVQSWPLAYWPDGTLKWTGH